MFKLLASIALGCGMVAFGAHLRHPQELTLRAVDDREAYVVYATVLEQQWLVRAGATELVVQQETDTYGRCLPSGGPLESDWRPVVESFKAENASARQILPAQPLNRPYIVVSAAQLSLLMGPEGDWSAFNSRYPNSKGFIKLSAVGFDSSKSRAMVYVAHHCGGTCGGGSYHLLEKVDRVWKRAKLQNVQQCIWIS